MHPRVLLTAALCGIFPTSVHAQQPGDADLARQLANPIASLISVPIQSNYDFGIGPGDGTKWTTDVQPMQFFGGVRYYLDTPAGGPEWGLRFGLTFLFPKS